MPTTLSTYLPQDRRRALAAGRDLPNQVVGTALFADISGFTPLTEVLTQELGPRRGIEELSKQINAVYDMLILTVESYGGSVISFAGDAITCWFNAFPPTPFALAEEASQGNGERIQEVCWRAVTAAQLMQTAMADFPALGLKIAVTSGPARRFTLGDPAIQLLDTLVGATIARLAIAQQLSGRSEILLDEATVATLTDHLLIREWRVSKDSPDQFAAIQALTRPAAPQAAAPAPEMDLHILSQWLLPFVFEREQGGHALFLTELRPVAILFLRFVSLDYDNDEQAGEKLNTLISCVQRVLSHYDSAILQLAIGDKGSYLYAAFGAPTAHEDDSRRAVQASLALRAACADLDFLPLIQIGLSQGVVRTGVYGGSTRHTYGVLGDDVNLAARLMEAAPAGEILLSEQVQRATAKEFVFIARPGLILKGKAKALTVYTVTAERPHRAIRLQEPAYALPMVGRQQELEIINNKLEIALTGKTQVIGIVAEAGLGKSRLVTEAIRLARQKGFIAYGGVCQSDAIHTPYQAWKGVWSAFFDIDPSAPTPEQMKILKKALKHFASTRVQAMPLLNIVLDLAIPDNEFTQTLEPKYRKSALTVLLEDCLRAMTRIEPILIVIEDLHWVDALSHDLLEELARTLNDCPLCFVLAYRPPQIPRLMGPRLERLPSFSKIELHELKLTEVEGIIQAKLAQSYPEGNGPLPPTLLNKLMTRTQGNPFYLEELLNYLHDRGLDPREPAALEKIDLPDSLHSLILSRIDQLSEHQKTTLRVASIIGRLFRADWLIGYYPSLGNIFQVKASLDELHALDITPLDTPEPELAYLFKHILTHEVTYESLPFATRSQLHEKLARYLENQIAGGTLSEAPLLDTLVYHYTRSEDQTKQYIYLQRAGQAALNVSAFNSALDYFTRLLKLTPENDPGRSTLALQIAEVYLSLSDFPMARVAIEQAQAVAQNDVHHAAALTSLGEMTSQLGDYAEAQTLLTQAVTLARTSEDQLTLGRVLSALGHNYWCLGKLDAARTTLDESLTLARDSGDVTLELAVLTRLGVVALQQNFAEAEQFFIEAHTRAAAMGNRKRAMVALNNLGVLADARQSPKATQGYIEQALILAREIGAQDAIALYLINLGGADIRLGQLSVAQAKLQEGMTLALRLGIRPWVVSAMLCFGELTCVRGQTERALALWGLARRQPTWSSDNQRSLEDIIAQLSLDPAGIEAGLAKGSELDWDQTIEEVLRE